MRPALKQRLFEEGLKTRRCERCAQGEEWLGRPMSLILDHVNGVPDDNRIENLQIVFVAVGCKYGVSDNAVRKWVRFYERQIERDGSRGRHSPTKVDRVRGCA
jgi:hypothetical protein